MIKIPVYLRDMCDAKHLVQAASGCEKNVDLICGRYIVDAKSMLGVFSLPTFDDVELFIIVSLWYNRDIKIGICGGNKHGR